MKVSNMKQSRFLSKTDLPEPPYGVTLTIASMQKENVAPPEQQPEMKYTLKFFESVKPFVCNITNATAIGEFLGDETDNWGQGKIELYYDPNVMMGPKRTGGIRVRQPQASAPAHSAPPQPVFEQPSHGYGPIPGFEDDIPQ